MWELDHKEGWAWKNSCFWNVVLEKTLESPLDCKEIQPLNPKENQPWIFIGRTDIEAEAPILWPPDAKSWQTGKDPDAGKDWGQEEEGATEDKMVEWHEFEQAPGDIEGQGRLVCCSPWGHKELDRTEWLNNNKMRVERPPQGKRLGDLNYKSGQSLIPGVISFKHFGLSFLILKLTSMIFKTLILWGTCVLNASLLTW